MSRPMANPITAPAPTGAQARLRVVQAAEYANLTGVKLVAITGGVVLMSLTPETPAEAQQINSAVNKLND